VGSDKSKKIDVRIIAATNRELEKSISEGNFREDLFYRLNVINIHLPALKERKEDIPYLIEFFLKKYNAELGKAVKRVTIEFLNCIQHHEFKGNIRELENVVERAIALSEKDYLDESDLPHPMRFTYKRFEADDKLIPVFIGETMKVIEERVIRKTFEANRNNQKATAEMLGLSDRTIRNKMKEYEASE
jgi:DNA-binding NtrC family response regulator